MQDHQLSKLICSPVFSLFYGCTLLVWSKKKYIKVDIVAKISFISNPSFHHWRYWPFSFHRNFYFWWQELKSIWSYASVRYWENFNCQHLLLNYWFDDLITISYDDRPSCWHHRDTFWVSLWYAIYAFKLDYQDPIG